MNLADKLCYPQNSDFEHSNEELDGLTFRERLIIALASNPTFTEGYGGQWKSTAVDIIQQADAIIKEMEK